MQPTKELIDELHRERVEHAREMSPEDKVLAGAQLFDLMCKIMADGIRDVIAVIDALDAKCIPYMVVGSLSCTYYGAARLTQDADFVVQLEPERLSALMTRLGPRFRLKPPAATESATAGRRYLIESADKACLVEFFPLSDDLHGVERFSRRRQVRFLDRDAFLPTLEDAVITKLRWFGVGRAHKDFQDAVAMIAVQGDRIDWDYVTSWCDRHGTRDLLDRVRECSSRP